MYLLFYDKTIKKEVRDEELIEFIKSLHIEYQNKKPQNLLIYKEKVVEFQLGIGDKENKCIFMYSPLSTPDEDTLIAFNPKIHREDSTYVYIFESNGVPNRDYKRCLINFEDALKEIEYFQENGCLSKNLKWYAY